MKPTLLSFCAAGCAALSNLVFRKNADEEVSGSGHLLCHYFVSFISSFIVCSDIWNIPWSASIAVVGATVGILNIFLMVLTRRALERGPTGIVFAFQNASAIFSGLLLYILFGPSFGFIFTYKQAIGMTLVLMGLFLATNNTQEPRHSFYTNWLHYAIGGFLVQVFALALIQWRCLFFTEHSLQHALVPKNVVHERSDVWFMPGMFFAASLVQLIIFLREKRKLQFMEIVYGTLSGILNGFSTYLLTNATKFAEPYEKTVLFPIFSVGTIILCNVWSSALYKENFSFLGYALCSVGIFIGSLT